MDERQIKNKVFEAYLKRSKGETLTQDEKYNIEAWELMKKSEGNTPLIKTYADIVKDFIKNLEKNPVLGATQEIAIATFCLALYNERTKSKDVATIVYKKKTQK